MRRRLPALPPRLLALLLVALPRDVGPQQMLDRLRADAFLSKVLGQFGDASNPSGAPCARIPHRPRRPGFPRRPPSPRGSSASPRAAPRSPARANRPCPGSIPGAWSAAKPRPPRARQQQPAPLARAAPSSGRRRQTRQSDDATSDPPADRAHHFFFPSTSRTGVSGVTPPRRRAKVSLPLTSHSPFTARRAKVSQSSAHSPSE